VIGAESPSRALLTAEFVENARTHGRAIVRAHHKFDAADLKAIHLLSRGASDVFVERVPQHAAATCKQMKRWLEGASVHRIHTARRFCARTSSLSARRLRHTSTTYTFMRGCGRRHPGLEIRHATCRTVTSQLPSISGSKKTKCLNNFRGVLRKPGDNGTADERAGASSASSADYHRGSVKARLTNDRGTAILVARRLRTHALTSVCFRIRFRLVLWDRPHILRANKCNLSRASQSDERYNSTTYTKHVHRPSQTTKTVTRTS